MNRTFNEIRKDMEAWIKDTQRPHVQWLEDYATILTHIDTLQSKHDSLLSMTEKLKSLILLTDPSVSDVEMNELSLRQWAEFEKWKEGQHETK